VIKEHLLDSLLPSRVGCKDRLPYIHIWLLLQEQVHHGFVTLLSSSCQHSFTPAAVVSKS
jgi:hypothetical protein